MIESLSDRWARWIKDNDPSGPFSFEVLSYSLKVTLNLSFAYLFCALIGLATGKLPETMLSLTAFVQLRMFSGGFHLKSLDLCTIVSTIALSALPHFAAYISSNWTIYVTAFSLILVIIFAPTNLRNTRWGNKANPYFKAISILIVSANFYIHSPILALSFAVQSLLLLPIRR